MSSDITLDTSTRSNLLALQTTTDLLNRTSNRLSTGLKVSTPIDNAPAYFASQALINRVSDFSQVQANIDQAVQTLNTAQNGMVEIGKLVSNLQGILTSLLTVNTTTASDVLIDDYNNLLTQIDGLAQDASYQGINLVNNTSQVMTIEFNADFGLSSLTSLQVNALESNAHGLGLQTIAHGTFFTVTQTVTSQPSAASLASIASHQSVPSFASRPALVQVPSQPSRTSQASVVSQASIASTVSNPSRASIASTASVASATSVPSAASAESYPSVPSLASTSSFASVASAQSVATIAGQTLAQVNQAKIQLTQAKVQSALIQLRSNQSTIGSNTTVLQIRLEFTKNYLIGLQTGSDKLTLADLNEEGANLSTLQTRQQLGTVSLSISTKSEQGLLRLF
jgi:flagellin